jgi:hypothetical protein
LIFLLCGIILERVIIKKNEKLNSVDKNFIVPLTSRLFAILAYFGYFIEVNNNYYAYSKRVIDNYFGLKIPNFLLALSLWYTRMPSAFSTIIWPLSFYIYLYGIARNGKHFYYFTRYHFSQVYLMNICGRFIRKIFLLKMKHSERSEFTEVLSLVIYMCFFVLIMFGMIAAFLGIESNIPPFNRAVVYQVGSKRHKAPC